MGCVCAVSCHVVLCCVVPCHIVSYPSQIGVYLEVKYITSDILFG